MAGADVASTLHHGASGALCSAHASLLVARAQGDTLMGNAIRRTVIDTWETFPHSRAHAETDQRAGRNRRRSGRNPTRADGGRMAPPARNGEACNGGSQSVGVSNESYSVAKRRADLTDNMSSAALSNAARMLERSTVERSTMRNRSFTWRLALMKMFYITVTLANGARVSGVLNARSEHDARRQVRDTIDGRNAKCVVVVSTF